MKKKEDFYATKIEACDLKACFKRIKALTPLCVRKTNTPGFFLLEFFL